VSEFSFSQFVPKPISVLTKTKTGHTASY